MKAKQIVVVSGKGGTGKTTISGSLAVMFKNHIVSDCDVDSSNLHLILNPEHMEEHEYWAGHKAEINESECIGCGKCSEICRFNAIKKNDNGKYTVDPFACEGCKACVLVCPTKAVKFNKNHPGNYYISKTSYGKFVHAAMKPGEEMSGGLVAQVRKNALKLAIDDKNDYVIIDGAPGIGCPATSSLTATDYAILVTEPTVSGIHDMKRMIEVIEHFRIPYSVIVNRYDINTDRSDEVESYCEKKNIKFLGKIPFDEKVNYANSNAIPIVKIDDSKASKEIKEVFNRLVVEIKKLK
jgi:MinD superfamily P-loop ATPase